MTTREGWWLLREMLAYLPRAEGFCGCPTQDTQTRVRFCIPQLGTTALLGVLQPLFFFSLSRERPSSGVRQGVFLEGTAFRYCHSRTLV